MDWLRQNGFLAGSDARRQAHPRHRRPDARADRPGPGDRQPLVGAAGLRHCRRGGRSRRAGDAGRRARSRWKRRRASTGSTSRPPSRWRTPSSRRCPPMPPSSSRPSPTGGSSPRRPSSRRATARRSSSSLPTRDILAELGASEQRPRLLVGFAAETERRGRAGGRQAAGQARRLDRRQRRFRRRHGRRTATAST